MNRVLFKLKFSTGEKFHLTAHFVRKLLLDRIQTVLSSRSAQKNVDRCIGEIIMILTQLRMDKGSYNGESYYRYRLAVGRLLSHISSIYQVDFPSVERGPILPATITDNLLTELALLEKLIISGITVTRM